MSSQHQKLPAHLVYEPVELSRPVDEKHVQWLAQSIKEIGLLSPIIVTPKQRYINGALRDAYEILAGVHRFRAMFTVLNMEEVPAEVRVAEDLDAELVTLDENLVRLDLGEVERAQKLARRKDIYEAKYPETKATSSGAFHGNRFTGSSRRQNGDDYKSPSVVRFTKDAAKKTGRGERSIQRDIEIAQKIDPAALMLVKGTALDAQRYLHLTLKPLPLSQHVAKVKQDLADLNNAQHARKAQKPTPPADPPRNDIEVSNKRRRALVRAWEQADDEDRAWFLEQIDRPVMDRRYG